MPKKVAVGVVISDKMQKTRRVEIPRLVKHPVYGKYLRQRTIYHVHDEEEASAMGDTVEIIEAQPRSTRGFVYQVDARDAIGQFRDAGFRRRNEPSSDGVDNLTARPTDGLA